MWLPWSQKPKTIVRKFFPDSDPDDNKSEEYKFISQALSTKALVTSLKTGLTIQGQNSWDLCYVQGLCSEKSLCIVVALVLFPEGGFNVYYLSLGIECHCFQSFHACYII